MSNKSNSKVVKEIVRKHILECINEENKSDLENLNNFHSQLIVNSKGYNSHMFNVYNLVEYTLRGVYKGFEFTTKGMENFIKSLDLNNKSNKKFNNEEIENMYYKLVSRELLYLFKKNNISIDYIFYR